MFTDLTKANQKVGELTAALGLATTALERERGIANSISKSLDNNMHELKQAQARADANADHAKLANQNQASFAKALNAASERIEQLETACIVRDNGMDRCLLCKRSTHMGQNILHQIDCLLCTEEK